MWKTLYRGTKHVRVDSPAHFVNKAAGFCTNKSDYGTCSEIVTQIQNLFESWGLDFIKVARFKIGLGLQPKVLHCWVAKTRALCLLLCIDIEVILFPGVFKVSWVKLEKYWLLYLRDLTGVDKVLLLTVWGASQLYLQAPAASPHSITYAQNHAPWHLTIYLCTI